MVDLKEAIPMILGFVIIGMLIAVGIIVYEELGDTARKDNQAYNETHIFYTENFTALANSKVTTGSAVFTNSSDGESISGDQFVWDAEGTYDGEKLKLKNTGVGAKYNGSAINVSYTFGESKQVTTALTTTSEGLDDFATWIATIVVIFASAVVIVIIRRSFGKT